MRILFQAMACYYGPILGLMAVMSLGMSGCGAHPQHYLGGYYTDKSYADRNIKAFAPFCGKVDGQGYRPCAALVTIYTRGQPDQHQAYVVGMWDSGTLVLSYQGKVREFAPDAPGTHTSMTFPPRPAFAVPATATGFACPAGKTFVHGFTCGYAPG